MCSKCHDDIALVDGFQILTGQIELSGLSMLAGDWFVVIVLAKSIFVDVQQKLGSRPFDLRWPVDCTSRPIRQTKKVQNFMLDLVLLLLGNYPVNDGLVKSIVDVKSTHPLGATRTSVLQYQTEKQEAGAVKGGSLSPIMDNHLPRSFRRLCRLLLRRSLFQDPEGGIRLVHFTFTTKDDFRVLNPDDES